MAYTNIDDPSAHFQIALYTGTGAAHSIGNDGNSDLKPDWVWIKKRSASGNHSVFDSTRGVYEELVTNGTNAEATDVQLLTQFDTDGFTVGTNGGVNGSGATFAAWQWKANSGTTSSNTDGDITSTVQVNSDAGFSIVTDSPPNNTARSIGHGLGVAPQVVIRRARNRVENWRVFHSAAGSTGALTLDDTSAYNSSTVLFTGVTSTTFGVGTDFSVNGNYNYISYCFAEKQGYSKFGKYVGNGNANGPFIYTGFKPAFFLLKKTSAADGWRLFDNKRAGYNDDNYRLAPDDATAEDTATTYLDILSNGVKIRGTAGSFNQSGGSYIYMAFAENPFTTSTGIPTTAR
nr:hypothetical protein [uncultured Mediterranean phage uvMED]